MAKRLVRDFNLQRVPIGRLDGTTVVLQSQQGAEHLKEVLEHCNADPLLCRLINAGALCSHLIRGSFQQAVDKLKELIVQSHAKSIRIHSCPKKLDALIAGALGDCSFEFSPTSFSHCAFIAEIDSNLLLIGVDTRYFSFRVPEDCHIPVSKAYFKLLDAFERTEVGNQFLNEIGPKSWCVDLGASPGGWTEYLSSKRALVISVDPGSLNDSLSSRINVVHVRMTAEDALNECKRLIQESDFNRPGFLCSDMNVSSSKVLNLIEMYSFWIPSGTRLILTIKFHRIRDAESHRSEELAKALETLSKHWIINATEWLLFNTLHERTVFGTKK
jgi:23S rRNA U2552 (ribose-2'-O)-methylase RlmE/FtsJ